VTRVGKICCVEKPMAVTFKECETILHDFKEKKTSIYCLLPQKLTQI